MRKIRNPKQLWSYIEKTDACWLWKGRVKNNLPIYGQAVAYRFVYELITETTLNRGEHVYHTCGNKFCVNPEHLLVGEVARFNSNIEKTDTCWNWTGLISDNGYGIFYRIVATGLDKNESRTRAHRYAYQLVNGDIPDDLIVLHICDNRKCVNPAHLRLGTYLDNNRDCQEKDRNARGERNGHALLTDEKVLEIRALKGKVSSKDIAAKYNISQGAISNILRGKAWKHLL